MSELNAAIHSLDAAPVTRKFKRSALVAASGLLLAGCAVAGPGAEQDAPVSAPAAEAGPATPGVAGNPEQIGRAVLLEGSSVQVQSQFGTPTFQNYINASRPGPFIEVGATATVDCWVKGPDAAAPSAHGTWYHFTAPDEIAGDFGAANTFWNQEVPGEPDLGNAVDPRIPACPDNIPAPNSR